MTKGAKKDTGPVRKVNTLRKFEETTIQTLNRGDILSMRSHFNKAYALIYALHTIAEGESLEELGDADAFILLDEAVIELQEIEKFIKKAA